MPAWSWPFEHAWGNWVAEVAVELYRRVKATAKLSGQAKVAVARHLAESTGWILTKKQFYREPTSARVTSSNQG